MDLELVRTTIGGSLSGVYDDSVFVDVFGFFEFVVGCYCIVVNYVFINFVGVDVEDDLLSVEVVIVLFIYIAFNDLKRLKVVCVEVCVGMGLVIVMNISGL